MAAVNVGTYAARVTLKELRGTILLSLLSTARSIAAAAADEFDVLITYDKRLADVAQADGLRVLEPS